MKTFAKIFVLSFFMLAISPILLPVADAAAQVQNNNQNNQIEGEIINTDYNQNDLVRVMCNVLKIVTGNFGKAFAAFAIISVGIGFFTGKVSWGLMIGVAAGIAAMFGAPTIVSAISGEDTFDCSA